VDQSEWLEANETARQDDRLDQHGGWPRHPDTHALRPPSGDRAWMVIVAHSAASGTVPLDA